MFYLEVIDQKKNTNLIELTYKATSFAISQLFPKIRKYDIKIKLKDFDIDGDCFEYDDRTYEININRNQSIDDFLTSVFHELVHVKQYIFSELGDYEAKNIKQYLDNPQEKEAFKLQEELLEKWKKN